MKHVKKITALLLSFLLLSVYFPFAFATENTEIAENNMDFATKTAEIVKESDSALRILGKFSKKPSDDIFSLAEDSVVCEDGRFVLQFSSEERLAECLEKLNADPGIVYAERDIAVYTQAVEDNGYLSWGVEAIEADIYSESITAEPNEFVTVAIIDSGCEDIDFIKDRLVQGYDFVENDSDAAQDESGNSHGTFLASIVTDCTRNLPVKIMPVRVLSEKEGSVSNVINGIRYAADNGADVINISLSAILTKCKALEDAVAYAEQKNVAVVVCAGNSKTDMQDFCPAHIESVITVSSINSDYGFTYEISNYGNGIDVAAPGGSIAGYNAAGEKAFLSGTSMSAAFVSAAAAMFRLENPVCNVSQVHNALVSSAKDYGDEGWDKYYGHGVLKLGKLINSTAKYVESVSFTQDLYELFTGNTLEINPVFLPADATDKTFTLSADGDNISINGNIITAVSEGEVTVTLKSNDGAYTDTAKIKITQKAPEINAILNIRNNPETKTIDYGETLRLTADIINKPENTTVWWYVDGIKTGEGETFEVSPESGRTEITAKLVDSNGNAVLDSYGAEISDSESVTVNDGFFQKIISFFKNLFRLNRTVIQMLFK